MALSRLTTADVPPTSDGVATLFGPSSLPLDESFAQLVEQGWDTDCAESVKPFSEVSEERDWNLCGNVEGFGETESERIEDNFSSAVSASSNQTTHVHGDCVIPNISACVELAYMLLPFNPPTPIWEQGVWADIFGDGNFLKSSWTTSGISRLPLGSNANSDAAGTICRNPAEGQSSKVGKLWN